VQIAGSAAASLGADAARESLAGAVAVAATLPAPLDALLLIAARDAFTSSLHVVAAASALMLFGVAVLVLTCLRHIRAIGAPQLSECIP
jgi:DHA2 family multidrug resistance protein-like MFS transporter